MKVFVDTSALYAILDPDDVHHREAAATFATLLELDQLTTHNYIHVETEQLVRRRLGPVAATALTDALLPSVATIWIDEPTHRAAVEARRASSGSASLVDHVSFVVMRATGIEVAFAFDRDFEAQGFRRPPSDRPGDYGAAKSPSDLVSVSEIAARAGRSVNTVQSWRRRQASFPRPAADLATGPIWEWTNVAAWIERRAQPPRRPGLWRGQVRLGPDFDAPPMDFEESIEAPIDPRP